MHWNEIVDRVTPSIVKIETPRGHGTGFLVFYGPAIVLRLPRKSRTRKNIKYHLRVML